MPPTDARTLCVSIHDVAPATWQDCLRLHAALREVADIPLTWLVVPHYHGSAPPAPAMECALAALLAQGHELALHGYTHVDSAAPLPYWQSRLVRNVYTQSEGEFAAIGVAEARQRLALGRAWFAERGWPLHGFVAPAWLLGEGAWRALRAAPFDYTTTLTHFHWLHGMPASTPASTPGSTPERAQTSALTSALTSASAGAQGGTPASMAVGISGCAGRPAGGPASMSPSMSGYALCSPSLVYGARNRAGRLLSPPLARALAAWLAPAPLVRLSLHPRDAQHPALLRHAQQLLARLLATRQARTKGDFARNFNGAAAPWPR